MAATLSYFDGCWGSCPTTADWLLPLKGGERVDVTLVATFKRCDSENEKGEIKAGRISEFWKRKPAKRRQKDRTARWTVKFTKAKPRTDGKRQVVIAMPAFGHPIYVSIAREHGLIRNWVVTDAVRFEGAMLRDDLLGKAHAASSALRGLPAAPPSAIGSVAFCQSTGGHRLPFEN